MQHWKKILPNDHPDAGIYCDMYQYESKWCGGT